MEVSLTALRDVFELAVTENFFGYRSRSMNRYCKIAHNGSLQHLAVDCYTRGYDSNSRLRRYKKDISIGMFYVTQYGIFYQQLYFKRFIFSKIKKHLLESGYRYVVIGQYLYFEQPDNQLPIGQLFEFKFNKLCTATTFVDINNRTTIIRLPYTKIGKILVPSKRTTRLCILDRGELAVEKSSLSRVLYQEMLDDLSQRDDIDIVDVLPILYSCYRFTLKTFDVVEQRYGEQLVKVLTK